MHRFTVVALVAVLAAAMVLGQSDNHYVGGYVLLSRVAKNGQIVGLEELEALAAHASSIPVNRIWLAFVSPTMVYVPGSKTLEYARLNVSNSPDFGFAAVQKAIAQLQVCTCSIFTCFCCIFCFHE